MRVALVLLLGVAACSALPTQNANRIVGGSLTTIDRYPFGVAILDSTDGVTYSHNCGGSIINNRSILTAAHCFGFNSQTWQVRSRVGSSYANSGGVVFNTALIISHPNYNWLDMDFALVRIDGVFSYNNNVQPGVIAGPTYNVADNQEVWAFGWGAICHQCTWSEQLRHVQIWTINQEVCRQRYSTILTDNMLCSGWLDVGVRDTCTGDSGGPLLHNNIIIGVVSFGQECAHPRYPGVNARVSAASNWIQANA